MNWKFWKKDDTASSAGTSPNLPKPKELPELVGQFLIVESGYDPDWTWALKGALCPRPGSGSAFDIRIFDETIAAQNGVTVKNYDTLDEYPELIIFEGSFDTGSHLVNLAKK